MKKCDVVIFAGQSNMAGRGDSLKAPIIKNYLAYEYRAISSPKTLHILREPFGENENNPTGIFEPGKKTGSLVASFAKTYTERTGNLLIGLSASKGGSSISSWQEGGPYFSDLKTRYVSLEKWLKENNYLIKRKIFLWLQGETDGDLHTSKEEYQQLTTKFLSSVKDLGIEEIFLLGIGNYREDKEKYQEIQEAQRELDSSFIHFIPTSFPKMVQLGLMKDSFHYEQEAYNIVGEELAEFVSREKI